MKGINHVLSKLIILVITLVLITQLFIMTREIAQKSINWTVFIQLIRRHLRYDCDYKN